MGHLDEQADNGSDPAGDSHPRRIPRARTSPRSAARLTRDRGGDVMYDALHHRKSRDELMLAPDSPLIDSLLTLSRAAIKGEPFALDVPAPTTEAERRVLESLANAAHPDNNPTTLHGTAFGEALFGFSFAIAALLHGTSPTVERLRYEADDALWWVVRYALQDRSDDESLAVLYKDALRGEGEGKREEIAAMREKFRRAVDGAERATDRADRGAGRGRRTSAFADAGNDIDR